MEKVDEDLDQLNEAKNTIPNDKSIKTLENKSDGVEDNNRAKIDLLEITSQSTASYTEMQVLVNYLENDIHVKQFGSEEGIIQTKFDERRNKLEEDVIDEIEDLKVYITTLSREDQQKLHNELVQNLEAISDLNNSEIESSIKSVESKSSETSNQSENSEQNDNEIPEQYKDKVKAFEKVIMNENSEEQNKIPLDKMNLPDLMKIVTGKSKNDNPTDDPKFLNFIKGVMGQGGLDPEMMKKNLKQSFSKLLESPGIANMVKKMADDPQFKKLNSNLDQGVNSTNLAGPLNDFIKNGSSSIDPKQINLRKEQEFERDTKNTIKSQNFKDLNKKQDMNSIMKQLGYNGTSDLKQRPRSKLMTFNRERIKDQGRLVLV